MGVQSQSSHQKRSKLNEISQKQKLLRYLPVAAGAVPFLPLGLPFAGGLSAGIADGYLRRKKAFINLEGIDDTRYQIKALNDCTVADGTFLGLGMPLETFKDGLNEHEKLYGRLTPDRRRAFLAQQLDSFHPVLLPDDLATRHIAMLGQTGVGKTETMLSLLQGFTSRGGGALVFEAKGGRDVPLRIYQMLKAQGREHMFRFLNFEDTSLSHSYNPFFSGSARSTISTGMMVLPQNGDEFFADVNRYALSAAIVLLKHQPGSPVFNIKDLVVLFSDLVEFARLYQKMPETSREFIEAKQFVFQFLNYWKTWDNQSKEYIFNTKLFQDRLMGLQSKLATFTHSEYGSLLNSYSPEIDIRKAIEEGQVVVISLSSLADSDGSKLLGKLIMADFARAVGDVHAAGTKPTVPFLAFLDEYPSFKAEFHEQLWQLVRSVNISLCLSAQGYNFLANESETFAKNILANCWTHLFYDVRDKETRQLAKDLSKTVINLFEAEATSSSYGHSQSSEQSGVIGNISTGSGRSRGFKATREELIQPEDMILEEGDGILISKSETYRMRLPLIDWEKPLLQWSDMELEHFDDTGTGLNLMERSFSKGKDLSAMVR